MIEQLEDTITAIATAEGPGAIGVVRVSGPAAAALARAALAGWPESPDSHRLYRCRLVGPGAELVDEVLACLMRAPRSYTGEDVLEIHAHGGSGNLRRVLGVIVARGARPAQPGEFTRRAYSHGRMDLLRAEAVAEVIAARSERAARLAQQALAGEPSQAVRQLRDETVTLLAEVEARVDFPEEDLDYLPLDEVAARSAAASARCAAAAAGFGTYRVLRDGAQVAIVGPPNAGKSSLLNALYGGERALVSATPGTTRDYLEVDLSWDGVPVRLIDTAGDREPLEELERRGVELGRARGREADLRLVVLDASAAATESAQAVEQRWPEPRLVIWNKVDLAAAPAGGIGVSATRRTGLEGVRAAVLERLGVAAPGGEELVATSDRQRAGFAAAAEALERAAAGARADAVPEVLAVELRDAARALAGLLGEDVGDAVLAEVFARFCIGK